VNRGCIFFAYFTMNMRQNLYCTQNIKWKTQYRDDGLGKETARTSGEDGFAKAVDDVITEILR